MNAPPRFRAAVFDMDGLLLDSERPIRAAWLAAAQVLGVPVSEADYLDLVGRNHVDSRIRMLEMFGGEEMLVRAGRLVDADLGERYGGKRAFDLRPGARRLVTALHAGGVPCAVASSTHRAEVQRRLRNAGLLDCFAAVCGGDEVARGKPHPDIYQLAVSRLGADPATTLAFEDSGHGAQAALAAGLQVVVVPDLKPPESPWRSQALAVLDSLDDACAFSAGWFGCPCAPP